MTRTAILAEWTAALVGSAAPGSPCLSDPALGRVAWRAEAGR